MNKKILPVQKLVFFVLAFFVVLCTQAQPTDYSNINNWAAHSLKTDYADSIPQALRKNEKVTKIANVFFIHPTSYTDADAYKIKWNASIDDVALNKKTDEGSILFQASCFNEQSNVFAPRYRQAHLQSFYNNTIEGKAALDTAYNDIKAAFEYFVTNLNNNKPIIIAAHSQGTFHAAHLIKDYFENKPLQQKLVAAYLIGMPARKNYFSTCKPCENAKSIGCFVSWRTYLENSIMEPYLKLEPTNSVYVTNPLTWTLDTLPTNRKNNKGAVLLKFNKVNKKVCAAQVHNNILWISKPKFKFSFLVKNKRTNYHIGDINLFYVNIRENVQLRLQEYFLQNENSK
jgi:Protein of unknown function (DUF3089)